MARPPRTAFIDDDLYACISGHDLFLFDSNSLTLFTTTTSIDILTCLTYEEPMFQRTLRSRLTTWFSSNPQLGEPILCLDDNSLRALYERAMSKQPIGNDPNVRLIRTLAKFYHSDTFLGRVSPDVAQTVIQQMLKISASPRVTTRCLSTKEKSRLMDYHSSLLTSDEEFSVVHATECVLEEESPVLEASDLECDVFYCHALITEVSVDLEDCYRVNEVMRFAITDSITVENADIRNDKFFAKNLVCEVLPSILSPWVRSYAHVLREKPRIFRYKDVELFRKSELRSSQDQEKSTKAVTRDVSKNWKSRRKRV